MTDPTPPEETPSASTETPVRSPGREASRVEARTPSAGEGNDGPETEITFPY